MPMGWKHLLFPYYPMKTETKIGLARLKDDLM
jgi:hypothetical protein